MARLRRVLAGGLLAPIGSVLCARLLAQAVGGLGLERTLPVGVHSYLPILDLISLPGVVVASILLAIAGVALVLLDRRDGRVSPLLHVAVGALATQVTLFAGQVLVVQLLHGVPDAGMTITAAAVLQMVASAVALGLLLSAQLPRHRARKLAIEICLADRRMLPAYVVGAAGARRTPATRRGPPHLLLSD